MHCEDVQRQLDEYLENSLPASGQQAVDRHIQHCPACQRSVEQAQQMILALREMPVAPPRAGYERRVLGSLQQQAASPARRHRLPLWFATGFATAMLAVFTVWFMFVTPGVQQDQHVAAITLHVVPQQVRKVDLVFTSPNLIQQATMRIELPADVELEGYAARRVLEWQADIVQGKNRLSLPLIAKGKSGGVLNASISHKGKKRTFQINIIANGKSSQRIPLDLTV